MSSDQHLALEFIKEHLTTQNRCSLQRNIQSKFEEFAKAQSTLPAIDREALIPHDPLRTAYYELYKDQEQKLMEKVKGLSALVFKKKKVSLRKVEQKRFREAEDEFVRESKKKMSIVTK